MTGHTEIDPGMENDDLAAARWAMAIEAGLAPERIEAFHAWLAARPERAELIARQATLQDLASRARGNSPARTNEKIVQSRRRLLIGGAVATGAAALGAVTLVMRAPWLDVSQTYATAAGEVRAVELADTSRLWLDARTRVSAHMTGKRRDLMLEAGRVFVEVAHEAERPFFVRAAQLEARAVGTAFEATLFPGAAGIVVAEGVVRLTPGAARPTFDLSAGEGAWIAPSGEATRTSAAARNIAAWRVRRMVLSDRRLDAALADLSRYFERPLTVADADLAARRISVSFSLAGLGEKDAAAMIASVVNAEVVDQGKDGILLRPDVRGGDATPPLQSPSR